MQKIAETAGKPASPTLTIDINKLIAAYYEQQPDPLDPHQSVHFGTSGHRGSSLTTSFNEHHVLAICQAICLFRQKNNINGPLFIGQDTHALSEPAMISACEVFAANGIQLLCADGVKYTPTPAISRAILKYNRQHLDKKADGVIITPSHNSPKDGGIKYNPPTGGPADISITQWIAAKANALLQNQLYGVKRVAQHSSEYHHAITAYDYLHEYVKDLATVLDMHRISEAQITIGVDPLGGAGTPYWSVIADYYHLNMSIINDSIDPTFSFLNVDWDGELRMNPASQYIVSHLIANKSQYDVSFALDTDHDRQGIITPLAGLLDANHYLAVMTAYLFKHRPHWTKKQGLGKTFVTSLLLDRLAKSIDRIVYEVPVGFRWFTDPLLAGGIGICGEQSAGSTFCCLDGSVWTTDKDGIISALLAAEMMAVTQTDLQIHYQALTQQFGTSYYQQYNIPVTYLEKDKLTAQLALYLTSTHLASFGGNIVTSLQTKALGNGADLGGVKIITDKGWCALRPSGTESNYQIFAESLVSNTHLQALIIDAYRMIAKIKQD